jgi:hypothetical protein
MSPTFRLCPECLARYRALRFEAAARWSPCLIPYSSLIWEDEAPPFNERPIEGHDECKHSLMLLISARKNLWRTGRIAAESESMWREANELLPNWPGFERLTLSAEELKGLDACEQEVSDIMEHLRSTSSIFAVDDKGGGVIGFIAYPRQRPQA